MPAPISVNESVVTPCGVSFITTAKHRNPSNKEASVWTITISEEYDCFIDAMSYIDRNVATNISYIATDNTLCWGVIVLDDKLFKLGENNFTDKLVFGKFTNHENNDDKWHGYPADFTKKPQDRPPLVFTKSLSSNGYISKSKAKKASEGRKCRI